MKQFKFKLAMLLIRIIEDNAPMSIRDYAEVNRLLVKAGRRCAYDLKHAAGSIWHAARRPREDFDEPNSRAKEDYEVYQKRASMWLNIFNPADDGKHYRDELHRDIFDLECKLKTAVDLLKANNIAIPESIDSGIPF